jgi:hypothetical protein
MIYIIAAGVLFIISTFIFIRSRLKGISLYIFLGLGIAAITLFAIFVPVSYAGSWMIYFGIFFPLFLRIRIGSDKMKKEDFNPEFLKQKRIEMDIVEYKKWLRRQYISLGAIVIQRKESGRSIPKASIDALKLLENESEEIAKQTGDPIPSGRKTSDGLLDYKNIK